MTNGAIIVDVREREAARTMLEHRMREAQKRRAATHSPHAQQIETARIDELLSMYLILLGSKK